MATPTASDSDDAIDRLVLDLFDVGAVRFGSFTLKSGLQSPFYVDLRVTVSHPPLLRRIAGQLLAAVSGVEFDLLCGVPYTALPFATCMSLASGTGMLMRRKEAKAHGTRKAIEGEYSAGQRCLIVEDLVTSGLSVTETVEPLTREAGLRVTDVVVLLDRAQGARDNLAARGITLHAVLDIARMVRVLVRAKRIDEATASSVCAFVREHQITQAGGTGAAGGTAPAASAGGGAGDGCDTPSSGCDKPTTMPVPAARSPRLSYAERARRSNAHAVARRLFSIASAKRSNLAVAADVHSSAELLQLADTTGPHICVLKTHADAIDDWSADTAAGLRALADRHEFLLFEDRKFADIGNTVVRQCAGGVHRIASWADLIDAHALPGPGIVDGLRKACAARDDARPIGLVLLAQMSSAGNLLTAEYTDRCVEMARAAPDIVVGFIAQQRLPRDGGGGDDGGGDMFVMTPGVQLKQGGDALGQQYNTPEYVLGECGSDFVIVGRGIYGATDAAAAAAQYQRAAWDAACAGMQ